METTAEAMQESEVTSENVKMCCLFGRKGGYMMKNGVRRKRDMH